jgi:hypothetical protein
MERPRLHATTTKEPKMKWIRNWIDRVRLEIRYRKKLKELRKRDPFIYK